MINNMVELNFSSEASLKSTFFAKFLPAGYILLQEIKRVDFVAAAVESPWWHYIWGEAKVFKRPCDRQPVREVLSQLVLTAYPVYMDADYMPPQFLACITSEYVVFIPFTRILPLFNEISVNWKAKPSDHRSDSFRELCELIHYKYDDFKEYRYLYLMDGSEDAKIRGFIAGNLKRLVDFTKKPVNENNFVKIFWEWMVRVFPQISAGKGDWERWRGADFLPCDFFLADLLSRDGYTVSGSRLQVLLKDHQYEFTRNPDGELIDKSVGFRDNKAAYFDFWNYYERPPLEIFWNYIEGRRDLLVVQDTRAVKGAFYTPLPVVALSYEYLGKALGADWQDRYVIWDCAAGSCNLLDGVERPYYAYASTLDGADVYLAKRLVERNRSGVGDGAGGGVERATSETKEYLFDEMNTYGSGEERSFNMLEDHIFQFDFLNDDFLPRCKGGKIPDSLWRYLSGEDKSRRIVFLINPPYGEAGNKGVLTGKFEAHKVGVQNSKMHEYFHKHIKGGVREKFVQFFCRIYAEVPGAIIAAHTTPKYIVSINEVDFRKYFKARFLGGFVWNNILHDNTSGQFPITFAIWDTAKAKLTKKQKEARWTVTLPVYESVDPIGKEPVRKNLRLRLSGEKTFSPVKRASIARWLGSFKVSEKSLVVGYISQRRSRFSFQNYVKLCNYKMDNVLFQNPVIISTDNFVQACIVYATSWCEKFTWLRDSDWWLAPTSDKWAADTEFQTDCVLFSAFHHNNISGASGGNPNHWIAFTEEQVRASTSFRSHFLSDFLKDKILSSPAQKLYDAVKALFIYYHKVRDKNCTSVDAGLYDIKAYFCGRNEKGHLRSKSDDPTYTALIADYKQCLDALGTSIAAKVHEYGFMD